MLNPARVTKVVTCCGASGLAVMGLLCLGVILSLNNSNRRTLRRLLVTASVVPSSPILVTLMKKALSSSETSVLPRAPRRNIPEDTILHFCSSPCSQNPLPVTTQWLAFLCDSPWGAAPELLYLLWNTRAHLRLATELHLNLLNIHFNITIPSPTLSPKLSPSLLVLYVSYVHVSHLYHALSSNYVHLGLTLNICWRSATRLQSYMYVMKCPTIEKVKLLLWHFMKAHGVLLRPGSNIFSIFDSQTAERLSALRALLPRKIPGTHFW
jgi:hypothetical protein